MHAFATSARTSTRDASKANPYHYGHIPEVTVHADGSGSIKKHYCMGRISHELVEVMPDERTALMGDDAANGGLFMFVADRPRDLSSARFMSPSGRKKTSEGGGSADLSWIKLGTRPATRSRRWPNKLKARDIVDAKGEDRRKRPPYTKIPFNGNPTG